MTTLLAVIWHGTKEDPSTQRLHTRFFGAKTCTSASAFTLTVL